MKTKEDDKRKGSRKKDRIKPALRPKKFQELVYPPNCFAVGRSLSKAVVGYESEIYIQAVNRDFIPIHSKDIGRMFEVFIEQKHTDIQVHFSLDESKNIIKATWTPKEAGTFFIRIGVLTNEGTYADIYESPHVLVIKDAEKSGVIVKKWAYDKEWNVEAARILSIWACDEEYHAKIINDIGIPCILDMTTMEPQFLMQPLMSLVISRLLQKDVFKRVLIEKGGVFGLITLMTLNSTMKNVAISQFTSRSLAAIGALVINVYDKPDCRQLVQMCDGRLFNLISGMLSESDAETRRNLARTVAEFSKQPNFIPMIKDSKIYPHLLRMVENKDCDMSTRRYALCAIANFSFIQDVQFQRKHFPDNELDKLVASVDLMFSEDGLVSECIRMLGNLSSVKYYSTLILTRYLSFIERLILLIAQNDSLARWEVDTSLGLFNGLNALQQEAFKRDCVNSFERSDTFDYEALRLLGNLLTNAQDLNGSLYKLMVQEKVILNIVHFMKSFHLNLQHEACKTIAALSIYEEGRKIIIRTGGLSALCSALNTCSSEATPYIVASLAQMPLEVKGALVNIIGDSGIYKLITLLKQSDKGLQKDTAILLATLSSNEEFQIVKQGGHTFLKSLIDLVRSGKVNVQTEINPQEIHYDKIIGEGISGVVWKATWRNQPVAVKKFNEESIAFSQEEFQSEVALMSVLRHPNIVHCIGSCTIPENLFIVSELFEQGSLQSVIENPQIPLPIPLVAHLALGAARGVKCLHELGIIHRDLKNGNLLVTRDWVVKVADFGESRMLDRTMTRGVGTPIYTAPEILAGNVYSQKADVYSFAFIVWELVVRQLPYEGLSPFEAARKASEENLRPVIPQNCIFEELIQSCWASDPNMRPDFSEIIAVLMEIQRLVGHAKNLSQTHVEEDEDLEDIQFQYQQASKIVHDTLRLKHFPLVEEVKKRQRSMQIPDFSQQR